MRIAIVNESFGIGGLERVTSVVGSALSGKHEVYYYSMFSKENFYEIEKNFYVGKIKNKWLNIDSYRRKIDFILKDNYDPSRYYHKEIKKLNKFIQDNRMDLIIISSHR